MRAISTRPVLAGLALLLAGTTSTLAADAQAFGDRLKAVMAEQSTVLEFSAATSEGDDVTLQGAQVKSTAPAGEAVSLGDLRFEGVTGSTPDGWRVDRVVPADVDQTQDNLRTRVSGLSVEGLQIKGTSDTTAALSPVFFERAVIGAVNIDRDGRAVASVENISLRNDTTAGGGYRWTFDLGRFTVDTTASGQAEGSAVMSELGYPQLTGTLDGTASWDPQTGAVTLDPLQLKVDDAGDLAFSYTITGYTPGFIQSLAQLSDQMKASNGSNDGSGMAIIGLISQLYLKSAELSFQDNSLTNRLLDYFSKQNNQTREQLVGNLTASLPLALAYLQNPDFQAEVTGAVKSFLDNPQSLRISIAPQAPVPATQIIGAAMGAPQTLPQVLNLTVRSGS